MATNATDTLCPRRLHSYPEHRRRKAVPDCVRYYCAGCKYDYDTGGPYGIDEVAVARAVAGDPPPYLHPEERKLVVRALVRRRDRPSLSEIARRACCSPRTVQRIQGKAA